MRVLREILDTPDIRLLSRHKIIILVVDRLNGTALATSLARCSSEFVA